MKNFLLIGLGRFGKHIAIQLGDLGHQVMAVDKDEEKINDILPIVTNAQIGDSTNAAFLKSLGVRDFDVCIVTMGDDFQSSLETTSLLKELGAPFVVARANRDVQEKFLLRNGADEVLYPEQQIAKWAAIRYSSERILDYFELEDGHAIFEVSVPKNWAGHNVGQLDIRRKHNISIMAIKTNGKLSLSITPDTVLQPNQTLLVLGEYRSLQKCFQI
ncbi:MAG: TrkA family potassium uptake protein [Clostridia bacterium]|nr:TrkA family potassium uptake protein [Clostridia bacterium]